MNVKAGELAAQLGVTLEGDADRVISGAAPLDQAGPEDISFAIKPKVFAQASVSRAGCLIVPAAYQPQPGQTVIRAHDPRGVFAYAVALLYPSREPIPGLDASARIAPSAEID